MSAAHLQILLDLEKLPLVAHRRNYVIERHIFLLALAKVHSVSIETMIDDLRNPKRTKTVTVSPMNLFPMEACPYMTWNL